MNYKFTGAPIGVINQRKRIAIGAKTFNKVSLQSPWLEGRNDSGEFGDVEEPETPVVEYDGKVNEVSLKEDGTILAGTGISPEFAASATDGLLQLFLIPQVAGQKVIGPSVNGVYDVNTPNELSLAFGVTRVSEKTWNITDVYDVDLFVGPSEEEQAHFKFDGTKIVAYNDPRYVITDSALSGEPTATIQNATRVRFLTEAKLTTNSKNTNDIYATLKAVHKATGKTLEVRVSVVNTYKAE